MALTAEQKLHLMTTAMKDEAFRDALLRDARAVVDTEFPLALSPEDSLHVIAPEVTDLLLVIPAYPADWPAGLSVAELEQRLTQEMDGLNEKQQQRYPRVIARAWHDASFRRALLQDPIPALEQELGVTLPAGATIQVKAEDAHTQYLVLPPQLNDMELSDEQLEQVSGGIVWTVAYLIGSLIATAIASGVATAQTFTDW